MRNSLLILLVILLGTSAVFLGGSIALEQWNYVAQNILNMVVAAILIWVVYTND